MSIRLGTIVGSEFFFGLWPKQLELTSGQVNTHKHVLGVPGVGKSKLLESLFLQSLKEKVATTFIDPTGRSSEYVLSYLIEAGFFNDPDNYKKLLYLEFKDGEYFFPLNILKIPWASTSETAQIVVEAFTRAYPEIAEGAALFYKTMDAALKVLIANNLPIVCLEEVVTSKPYRDVLLAQVSDVHVQNFWIEHDKLIAYHRQAQTQSTLNRAYHIVASDILRYALGQTENGLDVRALMEEGKFLLVNLGPIKDEKTQRLLGAFLTYSFENAGKSRTPDTGLAHQLILDEFSMFSAQSGVALSNMLNRTRQNRLFVTLAHQNLTQLEPRVHAALADCDIKISFRTNSGDGAIQAKSFGDFDQAHSKGTTAGGGVILASPQDQYEQWGTAFKTLPNRQALVRLGTSKTQLIKTPTLPEVSTDRAKLEAVKQDYFNRYYTKRSDIDLPLGQASRYTTTRRQRYQP